jgi:hypothetical protein
MDDLWAETKRLADISTEILIDTDEFVHAMPFRKRPVSHAVSMA